MILTVRHLSWRGWTIRGQQRLPLHPLICVARIDLHQSTQVRQKQDDRSLVVCCHRFHGLFRGCTRMSRVPMTVGFSRMVNASLALPEDADCVGGFEDQTGPGYRYSRDDVASPLLCRSGTLTSIGVQMINTGSLSCLYNHANQG